MSEIGLRANNRSSRSGCFGLFNFDSDLLEQFTVGAAAIGATLFAGFQAMPDRHFQEIDFLIG